MSKIFGLLIIILVALSGTGCRFTQDSRLSYDTNDSRLTSYDTQGSQLSAHDSTHDSRLTTDDLRLMTLDSAITRGNPSLKKISLVFTGDEFGDGGDFISSTLKKYKIKASFFLTGNFYRNNGFKKITTQLINDGHYLGSHSDRHLLYCDWIKRDSLLVTKEEFTIDLHQSYNELAQWGIKKNEAFYFMPPYEWYNDSIIEWTRQQKLQLICFTPGTRSTADYTYPEMGDKYVNSRDIFNSITHFEMQSPSGLNGFILLLHIGTDHRRTDKFYYLLPDLILFLKSKGYALVRIDEMLDRQPAVGTRQSVIGSREP